MKLKDVIPPVIVKLAKFLKQDGKLYSSYEQALAVCKSGYEENDLVEVVYEKTRQYRDIVFKQHPFISEISSLRTLIGLSLSCRSKELNVIDFGGACGAHYFDSKMVFGEKIKLRWHVVETQKMVSKAIELQDGNLRFFDNLQSAKDALDRVDLVFSSGALQYVPRPYEFLGQLVDCKASNIFITRVGLSTLPTELISVQKSALSANGLGSMPKGMLDGEAQYPVTFARKDRFEEILSKHYSVDILFNEDKGAYIAGGNLIDMYGYFGSLKTANNMVIDKYDSQ